MIWGGLFQGNNIAFFFKHNNFALVKSLRRLFYNKRKQRLSLSTAAFSRSNQKFFLIHSDNFPLMPDLGALPTVDECVYPRIDCETYIP